MLSLATIAQHGAPAQARFYGTQDDGCSAESTAVRITPLDKGWHLLTPLNGAPAIEVSPGRRVWLSE